MGTSSIRGQHGYVICLQHNTMSHVLRSAHSLRLAGLLLLILSQTVSATPPSLHLIGMANVPTGTMFKGTEIGGLSGIDYDPARDRYVAISDNRGAEGPVRFYTLTLDLADGRLDDDDVRFVGVDTIKAADGKAFAPGVVDPESIRATSFPGLYYWTSEGNARSGLAPFVRVMTPQGDPVAAFDIPPIFTPSTDHGIRDNLAFESLTHATDRDLWITAAENALVQDSPAASLATGSPVRVLTLDGATGKPSGQYVYITEPVAGPPKPAGGFATNGLSELLAVGPQTFIALERSYSAGVGNDIRLYLTSLQGASDVSGLDTLIGANYRPMRKRLLLDLATLDIDLDNIEGITRGPDMAGHPTLVLVADNNFSNSQRTQILVFRVDEPLLAPRTHSGQ